LEWWLIEAVSNVDLLDEATKPSQKTDLLFLISREGIAKGRLEDYRSAQNAVLPKTLMPILLSDDVLATVRKEIKRKTKHNVDPKDLKQAVRRILGED